MRLVRADRDGAAAAAHVLEAGGVVVVPTDTVYGLAARPTDEDAVQAVFRIKGRPERMPLPVLAASEDQVRALGVAYTDAARVLASRWWPGPLTMAFAFDAETPRPGWLADRDEVAVRVPDHEFLRRLLTQTGVLLVTSANPHGAPTPRSAGDTASALGPEVGLVVDGGVLQEVPSTLVNVAQIPPVVEREGAIRRHDIEAALRDAP